MVSGTDSRIKAECASCFRRKSLMSSHMLMTRKRCCYQSDIYLIQSKFTHTDRRALVHTQRHRKRPRPPAVQYFQTTISCFILTNRGTKAVMSQLFQTHLKCSPEWLITDHQDRYARVGSGEVGGRAVRGKLEGGREKVRDS